MMDRLTEGGTAGRPWRADGGGELHPVAAVDLHPAVVVHPGDAEQQAALRLHNPVDDAGLGQPLVLLHHGLEGLQHLADGLKELRLVGILLQTSS